VSPGALLQYLLPHRLLSRGANALARSEKPWLKDRLIDLVVRRFGVDMTEAADPNVHNYTHFNAFFTRALKPGARRPPESPLQLSMPADGKVSQAGKIRDGQIFQAKGHSYTVEELLGDAAYAERFDRGHFINVYLSPRDYHRVHMPWAGKLESTLHIPGRLFSVAPWSVASVPRLFARNERLVCRFSTDFGPMAVVMVGAMLVSGVETVWGGEEIPPYADALRPREWNDQDIRLERFDEMARFNYGSTVIVLLPPGAVSLHDLRPEQAVRLGEAFAERPR